MTQEKQHDPGCQCGCHAPMLSAEAMELLEKHHEFPGPFMFKVIGFCDGDFAGRARRAVGRVVGEIEDDQARDRESKGGKYVSVTLEVEMADSAQVLAVYEELKKLEGLVAMV